MKNEYETILTVVALFAATTCATRSAQLELATICAGAATLDNGSIINFGQPFVGVMSAPGGAVSVSSGLLSGLVQEKSASGVLAIAPSVLLASGRFQFCFPTQPGRNYVVQVSTNLSSWIPIWTNLGTWTGLTFEDSVSELVPYRFYRVHQP